MKLAHNLGSITARILALAAIPLVITTTACAVSHGPIVRVATATRAELEAARKESEVWYEFDEGDVIPVQMGYFGALEGGPDQPITVRIRHKFFIVMTSTGIMRLSFDGKTYAPDSTMQSLIAIVPTDRGAALGWLIYLGENGNPQADLKHLVDRNSAGDSSSDPAPQKRRKPRPDEN